MHPQSTLLANISINLDSGDAETAIAPIQKEVQLSNLRQLLMRGGRFIFDHGVDSLEGQSYVLFISSDIFVTVFACPRTNRFCYHLQRDGPSYTMDNFLR